MHFTTTEDIKVDVVCPECYANLLVNDYDWDRYPIEMTAKCPDCDNDITIEGFIKEEYEVTDC